MIALCDDSIGAGALSNKFVCRNCFLYSRVFYPVRLDCTENGDWYGEFFG